MLAVRDVPVVRPDHGGGMRRLPALALMLVSLYGGSGCAVLDWLVPVDPCPQGTWVVEKDAQGRVLREYCREERR